MTSLFALVLLSLCVLGHAQLTGQEVSHLFDKFVVQHGKKYQGSEWAKRFMAFRDNVNHIVRHNEAGHSYKLEINSLADLTWEEFTSLHLGASQDCSATGKGHTLRAPGSRTAHVDWREKGVVSAVKNQGHCGSCWTFSTTGCLEAHYAIKHNASVSLSEQQLIDCAQAFDNHGCSGGLPSQAFEYIRYNGGLNDETAYPYEAVDHACRFKKDAVAVTVPGGSVNITQGDEDELADAVANIGPVSIAFQVVQDFRFYKSGVYTSADCKNSSRDVNHAVLAVGYGTADDGTDYWIVKNSWGDQWGDQGYFRIARGVNMCGVSQCAAYPLL